MARLATPRRLPLALALLLALVLASCGGDDGGGSSNRTPGEPKVEKTPTTGEGKQLQAPDGIDAKKIGVARDRLVATCVKRRKDKALRSDAETTSQMREDVTTLIDAFEQNSDEKFRRSPGVPPTSMRQRVQAMALVLRSRCGGGTARTQVARIVRALRENKPE